MDWQTLGINFVLVYSPNAFRGAPHTHIATLTFAGDTTAEQDAVILRDMATAFPAVTTVRVKDAHPGGRLRGLEPRARRSAARA